MDRNSSDEWISESNKISLRFMAESLRTISLPCGARCCQSRALKK